MNNRRTYDYPVNVPLGSEPPPNYASPMEQLASQISADQWSKIPSAGGWSADGRRFGYGASQYTDIATLDQQVLKFRKLLLAKGVRLQRHSPLDRRLARIEQLSGMLRDPPSHRPTEDTVATLWDALGFRCIIGAVESLEASSPATMDRIHWACFRGPDATLTSDLPRSKERDAVWEVLVAATSSEFATDVVFAEPDIRCSYSGTSWGLACKVLYSPNRDAQIDRIVEGVKQIEGADTEMGAILVNVTNQVDHATFRRSLREAGVFRDPPSALTHLENAIHRFGMSLNTPTLRRRLNFEKSGKPRVKTTSVILYAQAMAVVGRGLSVLKSVTAVPIRAERSRKTEEFLFRLQNAGLNF